MSVDKLWWVRGKPQTLNIPLPTIKLPGHSIEDSERIFAFKMRCAERKRIKHQDMMCRKGQHGFNIQTTVGGGWIHSRCTHCGKSWSTPDTPVM